MVWRGMLALATIAGIRADALFLHRETIQAAMEQGSVITRDGGIKVIAAIAAHDDAYREVLFPYLLQHLATCRPKDVPQHAESAVIAVNARNEDAFIRILQGRMEDMSSAQLARVRRVIHDAEQRVAG